MYGDIEVESFKVSGVGFFVMCEYIYENGKKCRLKLLEGLKYCVFYIFREEGEVVYGERLKEIKKEVFEKRLKVG